METYEALHVTAILVVDDDRRVAQVMRTYLSREGYAVQLASTGEDALYKAHLSPPDLVILELILPDAVDGCEVCRRLRANSDVPIIVVTRRNDAQDVLAGFELGVDDYVTKPFNPRELMARVRAVLRRTTSTYAPSSVLMVGDVRVDPLRYEVTVGGQPVAMALKEFTILALLARNPGVILPRERLVQLVWPAGRGRSRALAVHVSWLRQKLRGGSVRIDCVWGRGYRLAPTKEVRQAG